MEYKLGCANLEVDASGHKGELSDSSRPQNNLFSDTETPPKRSEDSN